MPKFFILRLFIVSVFFSSCFLPSVKTFKSNSNGWRPTEFVPSQGVLMIERVEWPKTQQRKIEAYMKKKYRFKYEFVDFKDLTDSTGRYADKNIYRFAMAYSYDMHRMSGMEPGRPSSSISMFDFHFIDRLKGKSHAPSGIGSSWASVTFKKMMEAVLKN